MSSTFTKAAITFQSSASNSAAATTTGTAVDLTTALEHGVTLQVANGSTGPTVACDMIVEVSYDNSNWWEFARITSDLGNSVVSTVSVDIPDWVLYARSKFTGNTGQSCTVQAFGGKVSSIG